MLKSRENAVSVGISQHYSFVDEKRFICSKL